MISTTTSDLIITARSEAPITVGIHAPSSSLEPGMVIVVGDGLAEAEEAGGAWTGSEAAGEDDRLDTKVLRHHCRGNGNGGGSSPWLHRS